MLRWLIGNILGDIICESSNWQHIYTKIEDHYFRCNLATFSDWKGLPNVSYFYFVYTKHQVLLICNENKENYVANLMIQ